jgi:hypothetical protein
LAKRKEVADEKVTEEAVASSEAPPIETVKPATKSLKRGKLLPKNKVRLPRRLKKAQKKAAMAAKK